MTEYNGDLRKGLDSAEDRELQNLSAEVMSLQDEILDEEDKERPDQRLINSKKNQIASKMTRIRILQNKARS